MAQLQKSQRKRIFIVILALCLLLLIHLFASLVKKEEPAPDSHRTPVAFQQTLTAPVSKTKRTEVEVFDPLKQKQEQQEVNHYSLPVTEGFRAVSFEVDAASSIEGHALPGSRVDVFLTYIDTDKDLKSKLLIQNAKVLSYGGSTQTLASMTLEHVRTPQKSITIEVETSDALAIVTATKMGKLNLALRSPEDTTILPEMTSEADHFLRKQHQKRKFEFCPWYPNSRMPIGRKVPIWDESRGPRPYSPPGMGPCAPAA